MIIVKGSYISLQCLYTQKESDDRLQHMLESEELYKWWREWRKQLMEDLGLWRMDEVSAYVE